MNFKNELNTMKDRMFSSELYDALLEAYQQEAGKYGAEVVEKEYDMGIKVLSNVLNEEQKERLSKMEDLCKENVKYCIRFGFTRGVYAGFEHFFDDFVCNQILVRPNMEKYSEYYQRRCKTIDISATLDEQLDTVNREHLTSIFCAWDSRLNGILRHSFYMGYRYAISIIDNVKPFAVFSEMLDKILLTEYELEFINTVSEQEQQF